MPYRTTLLALAAGSALTLFITEVVSQDAEQDMAAAMAEMAKWMNPTDVHRSLEPLVGEFNLDLEITCTRK